MDSLDLIFRRLVLAARAAEALEHPIDVRELVDRLVPYRAARRDGLLETNDDYLHAVMRLLAGERELVFADESMQDDLRNELKGSNPDLGLLRTYLNVQVRLSTIAVQRVLDGDTEIDMRPPTPTSTPVVVHAPTPVTSGPVGTETPRSGLAEIPIVPDGAYAHDVPPAVTHDADNPDEGGGCPYCAQPLPADRAVRYCPSCGIDLRLKRCAGCSAEVESGWKYCVTCGRTAA